MVLEWIGQEMKLFVNLKSCLAERTGITGVKSGSDSSLHTKLTQGGKAGKDLTGTWALTARLWSNLGDKGVPLPRNDA